MSTTMRDALRHCIQQYLAGNGSLRVVREWLEDHSDRLFDSEDMALREMADVAWSAICEGDAGAPESAVRAQIAASMSQVSG